MLSIVDKKYTCASDLIDSIKSSNKKRVWVFIGNFPCRVDSKDFIYSAWRLGDSKINAWASWDGEFYFRGLEDLSDE